MVKSLLKVDFSHPTSRYIHTKNFARSPPLEKLLGAPLSPTIIYTYQKNDRLQKYLPNC